MLTVQSPDLTGIIPMQGVDYTKCFDLNGVANVEPGTQVCAGPLYEPVVEKCLLFGDIALWTLFRTCEALCDPFPEDGKPNCVEPESIYNSNGQPDKDPSCPLGDHGCPCTQEGACTGKRLACLPDKTCGTIITDGGNENPVDLVTDGMMSGDSTGLIVGLVIAGLCVLLIFVLVGVVVWQFKSRDDPYASALATSPLPTGPSTYPAGGNSIALSNVDASQGLPCPECGQLYLKQSDLVTHRQKRHNVY